MTNVIRLDGQPSHDEMGDSPATGISALRLITGMDAEEFAGALSKELGWSVPLFVYLQWERDGGVHPPPEVLDAARKLALRYPIGKRRSSVSRRHFLGGVVGFSALAAVGFPIEAQSFAGTLNIGDSDRKWRVSDDTAADLEALIGAYRRAYAGKAAVADLLPGTTGLMRLLFDLRRRDQWPGSHARLASLVGQAALLAGLLYLMGPRDLTTAKAHYNLALQSAREAEDWDLASYVLGSLAFQAISAQQPADGRVIMDAAWDLASRQANPRTRAWAAALASELYARDGNEVASRRLMAKAFTAIEGTRSEPSWKGIGWFDEARLISYDGGNLLLLGRHSEAEELLRRSLKQLDPLRLKHRCTTSADLAMALAESAEVEEACARATEALTLAISICHRESIERVRGVHFRLLRWRTHPAVRQLTERLEVA